MQNVWDCHKSIIAAGCTTFTNVINSQCSDVSTYMYMYTCQQLPGMMVRYEADGYQVINHRHTQCMSTININYMNAHYDRYFIVTEVTVTYSNMLVCTAV